jgi:hypothetical protein
MSGLIDSIFGSSKETTVNQLPGQIADINATNQFRTGTMMPTWQNYTAGATQGYNQALPGMMKQAQNVSGYAQQVGQTLGETGESAARTGISGLEQVLSPGYGQEQFQAAMAPIQGQYQQNLANQSANFGGAGQLGSARQALAGTQLAGQNQAAQMQAAANVMNNLNQQRITAANALAGYGQNYLGAGLNAQGTALGAAERPMDWYSTLGKQYSAVPQTLMQAQYPGQQSTTQSSSPSLWDIGSKVLPFLL